jgi:hypothetical protein
LCTMVFYGNFISLQAHYNYNLTVTMTLYKFSFNTYQHHKYFTREVLRMDIGNLINVWDLAI